jgi:hypothetical protein
MPMMSTFRLCFILTRSHSCRNSGVHGRES